MREILFRGFHPDANGKERAVSDGETIAGYWILFGIRVSPVSGHTEFYQILRKEDQDFDVIPSTIGQYTGLTDKDGKKIFEGDVVCTVDDGIEKVFVVVWDNSELDFKATNGKENYGVGGFRYLPCCDEVEIIGNIHDTPEILEETK